MSFCIISWGEQNTPDKICRNLQKRINKPTWTLTKCINASLSECPNIQDGLKRKRGKYISEAFNLKSIIFMKSKIKYDFNARVSMQSNDLFLTEWTFQKFNICLNFAELKNRESLQWPERDRHQSIFWENPHGQQESIIMENKERLSSRMKMGHWLLLQAVDFTFITIQISCW